jgi:hypothetical protein
MGATPIRDLFLIASFNAAQRHRRAGVLIKSVNRNKTRKEKYERQIL